MALAEVRAAYDTLKEESDLKMQDLTEELSSVRQWTSLLLIDK